MSNSHTVKLFYNSSFQHVWNLLWSENLTWAGGEEDEEEEEEEREDNWYSLDQVPTTSHLVKSGTKSKSLGF